MVHYFSPLFIGEFSSTCGALRRFLDEYYFSPLFIGEFSSTSAESGHQFGHSTFQSPLHRGVLFNCQRPTDIGCEVHISVPSSSGSSLQPHLFQLPNTVASISVPSSSGSSLQRLCSVPLTRGRRHFSPLFIGEFSSTSSGETVGGPLAHFSPLFIGEFSSTTQAIKTRLLLFHFSPLFIGEFSSTKPKSPVRRSNG